MVQHMQRQESYPAFLRSADMENEKNKEQYYGYERLVSLGGFIGAKAKSILYGLTTEGVRDAIEHTGGIDASFWRLVPELEFIDDEYATPESYTELDDGTEEAVFAEKGEGSFYQFRMIATAMCIRESIKRNRKPFFAHWTVSRKLRKILDGLTPLEEAILCEWLGFGKSEAGSVDAICKNMSFYSTHEHIRQILYKIDSYFRNFPKEREELSEFVKKQKEGGL